MEDQTQSSETLKKGGSLLNVEYLNLILACQTVIWGISSRYRLCQSWLIQQTSTLVVARR